ncbi:ER-derived vesicles protein ERV46, partial [Sistotremastrum niveocremeum HHB9708]
MAKGIFGGALKSIDAFGKTMEDVKVKTRTGAMITLVAAAIILTFTSIEFFDYRRVNVDTSILVDRSRGEKLTVRLNVTFPRVPCYLLSLDVMDVSGEQQRDYTHNIIKTRIDQNGVPVSHERATDLGSDVDKLAKSRGGEGYCGSCYGGVEPEGGCCQTCEDVRQAYVNRGWSFSNPDAIEQCVSEGWTDKLREQSSEGCNIAGGVRVNKVFGKLHFSPGQSFQTHSRQAHTLVPYLKDENKHDFAHHIHQFQFEGDDDSNAYKAELTRELRKKVSLDYNPLDGYSGMTDKTQYMFQYFLKVVSTRFSTLKGETVNTHQYSVTHFERDLEHGNNEESSQGLQLSHGVNGIPGAFFSFEISPILVVHTETRQSFAHFITSTCAIVGGVLTIASILDSVLFATSRALKSNSANGYSAGK